MSDKPQRSFWQLHLLTLVVMTLFAAVVMYPFVSQLSGEDFHKSYESARDNGYPDSEVNYLKSLKRHRTFEIVEAGPFALAVVVFAGAVCEFIIRRSEGRKI